MEKFKAFGILATALLVLGFCTPGSAEWNVQADFSLSQNPNGAWSYGYSDTLTGKLNLYEQAYTHPNGIQVWSQVNSSNPCAVHNPNSSAVSPAGTNLTWPSNSCSLHPGLGGVYSRARWTVPRDGYYDIDATFSAFDSTPTTSDVHVLINNSAVFDSQVNYYGAANAKTYAARSWFLYEIGDCENRAAHSHNRHHELSRGVSKSWCSS